MARHHFLTCFESYMNLVIILITRVFLDWIMLGFESRFVIWTRCSGNQKQEEASERMNSRQGFTLHVLHSVSIP